MQVQTIGIDLAKNVFQIHGVDDDGNVVVARRLRRKQLLEFFGKIAPCLIGMEACGTAHYWATRIGEAWSQRPDDAAQLCERLRQAFEE